MSVFGLANFTINMIDVVAISMVGFIGAAALGGSSALPFLVNQPTSAESFLPSLLIIAALLFAAKTVIGILLARTQNRYLARIDSKFSSAISNYVFRGKLETKNRHSKAEVEWAVLRSTEIAFQRILGLALTLVSQISLIALILGLFLYSDWLMTAIVFGYFFLVLLVFQFFTYKRSKDYGAGVVKGSIALSRAVEDTVVAFREITVLSRLSHFLWRISTAKLTVALGQANQLYLQAIPRLVVELALIIGAIGFFGIQFIGDESSPDFGILSVFIVGSLRLTSGLLPLQRAFMDLRYLENQAEGAHQLIREAGFEFVDVENPPETQGELSPRLDKFELDLPIRVEATNLAFSYPDSQQKVPTLQGLSFAIEPGSSVAFIGPSGAGKSTLVDLILGLLEPTEGQVLCNGEMPRHIRLKFPGSIGYVPQRPGLVSGSIRDNVALGIAPEHVDDDEVWRALKQANLEAYAMSLEKGIDTNLGNYSDALSGGQAQRLGLARALYSRPRLLVLDEATSALDAETEASIASELESLRGRVTVITVAHRLSTVKNADRVMIVENGVVTAQGGFRELMQDSELLQKYISLMNLS